MAIDRRIKKTKTAIISATVSLLTATPINKLTVKEICDSANISRSTFYLHFYDAYDVIKSVYDDISLNISKLLDRFDFAIILSNPRPFLIEVVEFVKTRSELYSLLTESNYHSDFRRKLAGLLKDK
ncbi:MAG: TetR/AcrR family transcriptional regulator, partial [Clostridia bacterium]